MGRTLFINEMEEAIQAWFEASSALGGAARQYDSPQCVYRGLPHDDYIEGSYEDLFNTDEADEEAGREPCGDRARSSGTLQLTDALGIAGRIRWRDYHYIDTVASACEAYIHCERDIRIEGLEK